MTDTPEPAITVGDSNARVIAIVGPTAVGKSTLAQDLAVRLDGEIVSADSMQVYRGMDIGTAKLSPAERRVPHHCLDLIDPGEDFSAALYQRVAREAIASVLSRGRVPVVTGGTGLYVRAALDDMRFPLGDIAGDERQRLEDLAESIGSHELHARLAQLDPDSAAMIHPNNLRRVIRALEMAAGGASYAEQAAGFAARASVYDTRFIGLDMERDALYARIDERVDDMLANGLLDEIRGLLEAGFRGALTAAQAIGYKEFLPVIDGVLELDDAVAQVKQASRRYAKRQLTWFRSDPRIGWIDVTVMSRDELLDRALELLESPEHPDDEPRVAPER